jgi:hypothetical protein
VTPHISQKMKPKAELEDSFIWETPPKTTKISQRGGN